MRRLPRPSSTTVPSVQTSIEVGYKSRAGMDLAHHVGLWDILSRNAIFLTGNGVTDDHSGTNWLLDHEQLGHVRLGSQ